VRNGRKEQAKKSLKRLARRTGFNQHDADAAMACKIVHHLLGAYEGGINFLVIVYTDEMEKQMSTGASYWDCFKGLNLRRTEIVCMTWVAQAMCGTALGGLSSYFFEHAGISASSSFKLSWGQSAIGALGTIASWFVLDRIGRKTLMLTGMMFIFVLLM
jgi:SP family general alpha glucoside:H+ symporter-like MFS transporter